MFLEDIGLGFVVGLGRGGIGLTLFFLRFGGGFPHFAGGFGLLLQLVGLGFEGFLAGFLLGGVTSGESESGN